MRAWKGLTATRDPKDGTIVLRPKLTVSPQELAERALGLSAVLAKARGPLRDAPVGPLPGRDEATERAVAALAQEVSKWAEQRRPTFVADPNRRVVLDGEGRVVCGGWAQLASYARERGIDLGHVAEGALLIRNAEGDVRVRRRPVRYLDARGEFRIR